MSVPKLSWISAYEKTLDTQDDGSTERVSLSHGYDKGELRRTLVHLRRYTAKGAPTKDGIFFLMSEIPFLREQLEFGLVGTVRERKVVDDRTIIVKSKSVKDFAMLPSTSGDVVGNGWNYKPMLTVGFRKDNFCAERDLELHVARRLMQEFDVFEHIQSLSLEPPAVLFERAFGLMLLRLLNNSWDAIAHGWLDVYTEDEALLRSQLADYIDFEGVALNTQMWRIGSAFGMPQKILHSVTIAAALEAVKQAIARRTWENTRERDLFCTIARVPLE